MSFNTRRSEYYDAAACFDCYIESSESDISCIHLFFGYIKVRCYIVGTMEKYCYKEAFACERKKYGRILDTILRMALIR